MLTAIILPVCTGLIWTSVGIVFKYLATKKMDAQKYFLLNYFFTGLLGLILFCNFNVVLAGDIMNPGKLLMVFGLSGLFHYFGVFFLQKAMHYGHSGVVWSIGQSALIVPFLAGILIFNQIGTSLQYIGVVSILIGVLIPSLVGDKNSVHEHKGAFSLWFCLAMLALLSFGTAQTLANIPSYWLGWSDNAGLRPSLGAIASCITVLIVFFVRRKKIFPISRILIGISFLMSCIGVIGLKILFLALDRLSSFNMGAIGYPIAVGSCIAGFSIYSIFVIKEKVLWQNWIGLIATIAGIIIISL